MRNGALLRLTASKYGECEETKCGVICERCLDSLWLMVEIFVFQADLSVSMMLFVEGGTQGQVRKYSPPWIRDPRVRSGSTLNQA